MIPRRGSARSMEDALCWRVMQLPHRSGPRRCMAGLALRLSSLPPATGTGALTGRTDGMRAWPGRPLYPSILCPWTLNATCHRQLSTTSPVPSHLPAMAIGQYFLAALLWCSSSRCSAVVSWLDPGPATPPHRSWNKRSMTAAVLLTATATPRSRAKPPAMLASTKVRCQKTSMMMVNRTRSYVSGDVQRRYLRRIMAVCATSATCGERSSKSVRTRAKGFVRCLRM